MPACRLGALLVGRRRPVPFEPDTIGTLDRRRGDRLGEASRPGPRGPQESRDAHQALREPRSCPSRGGRGHRGERPASEPTRWRSSCRRATASSWREASGLPEGATAPGRSPTLTPSPDARGPSLSPRWTPRRDPALARCLGTTPRAVLPLAVDEWLVALLALGSAGPAAPCCRPPFTMPPPSRSGTRASMPSRYGPLPMRRPTRNRHRSRDTDAGAAPLGDMASLLAVVLGRLAAVRDRVGDSAAARDLAPRRGSRLAGGGGRPSRPRLRAAARRAAGRPRRHRRGGRATRSARPSGSGRARAACRPSRSISSRCRRCASTPRSSGRPCTISCRTRARRDDSAAPVTVSLRWNGATHVELSVADRGRGMDEARARGRTSRSSRRREPGASASAWRWSGPWPPGTWATSRSRARRGRGRRSAFACRPRQVLARAGPRPSPRPRPSAGLAGRRRPGRAGEPGPGARARGLSRAGRGDVGEAVALLGREPVDLVVTDLALPGGSGLEVARTAKRAPVTLPWSWSPAGPDEWTRRPSWTHGIDAVVEKPVGLEPSGPPSPRCSRRASARRR